MVLLSGTFLQTLVDFRPITFRDGERAIAEYHKQATVVVDNT